MDGLACLVTITPVVAGADAALANIEVLWVVDVLVGTALDSVDDSGLQINQDGSWDVPSIVALVEEDVFAVTAFRCKVFESSILINSMLLAELLPELAANWKTVSIDRVKAAGGVS